MRTFKPYIILFFAIVWFYFSCKPKETEITKSRSLIEVTDFRGKKIKLYKHAERVVCLIESGLSGIYMLQAENSLVGVPSLVYSGENYKQYSKLDKRISSKQIPAPGNWDFVNVESVIALKPDLVIIWSSQKESIDLLEAHGIKVYGVFINKTDDIYKEIIDFGKILDTEERSQFLVQYSQSKVNEIKEKTKQLKSIKKVYFFWSQGLLETTGKAGIANEIIDLAGAKNVITLDEEHPVINKEQLYISNPDVIYMWDNPKLDPPDIMKMSELSGLNAVKNKSIFEMHPSFYYDMWTLKYLLVVHFVAKNTYPEIFPEDNFSNEQKSIMTTLYDLK